MSKVREVHKRRWHLEVVALQGLYTNRSWRDGSVFTSASYESLRPEFRYQDPWVKLVMVLLRVPALRRVEAGDHLGLLAPCLVGQCKLRIQQEALPPKERGGKREEDTGYSLLPHPRRVQLRLLCIVTSCNTYTYICVHTKLSFISRFQN